MTNLGKIAAFVLVGMVLAFTSAFAQDLSELRRKAESGDADAQYNLGERYAKGVGVPQDIVEAHKWWLKAGQQGDAKAQYNLGVMYDNGRGVPRD